MKITILNAGQQTDYLYGIVSGLSRIDEVEIEVVDSDRSIGVFNNFPNVKIFNLRGDNVSPQSIFVKSFRILRYYWLLLCYSVTTDSKIFHIQWEHNSIAWFDRTLLILFYKMSGKKIVYTSHNVYKEERDGHANFFNWSTLKIMYSLVNQIIVHTSKMREELIQKFGVDPKRIDVVKHGINNRVISTGLTKEKARLELGITSSAKLILFFGLIDEYKGLDILLNAFNELIIKDSNYVLLIAGCPKRKSNYIKQLRNEIETGLLKKNVISRFQNIPVKEIEKYFCASDCIVLPYKKIFQSGVIFLAYRFGIPIIATDIGSFREDVIHGVTGFICSANNPDDMALKIEQYFSSDLYHHQETTRIEIIRIAEEKYSWVDIGKETFRIYKNLESN